MIETAKEVFTVERKGLEYVSSRISSSFNLALDIILPSRGRVLITGMGKSGLVGAKIAATLSSTGTRSYFVHPSEAYHGDLGMFSSDDIVIAISNSGETEEVIRLLSFFKENKNKVIAMTGNLNSTLAENSDCILDIGIEKEACSLELAPTTSTTVTMCMGDALAVALMKKRNFKPENFARFHPGGSLGRKLLTRVEDSMKEVSSFSLSIGDDFSKIISMINKGKVGHALVVDDEILMGIISDGDLRRAISIHKEKIFELTASDIMISSVKTIAPSEKLSFAEDMMKKSKISGLPVVDGGRLVGFLSLNS